MTNSQVMLTRLRVTICISSITPSIVLLVFTIYQFDKLSNYFVPWPRPWPHPKIFPGSWNRSTSFGAQFRTKPFDFIITTIALPDTISLSTFKKKKTHIRMKTPCPGFKLFITCQPDLKIILSLGTLVPLDYSSPLNITPPARTVQPTCLYRQPEREIFFFRIRPKSSQ